MTYCVGLRLNRGLVFMSDTRTNAGVDNFSMTRKMFTWEAPGERVITIMTAGNLATTQSLISLLEERSKSAADRDPSIMREPTMFQVARLVGATLQEVIAYSSPTGDTSGSNFRATVIVGGQIKGGVPTVFMVYPEGNFIEATEDTPFLQIGEHKYGKPILDRVVRPDTSLEDAQKAVLLSMDSTLRSNLSVGMPLDLAVIEKDDCKVTMRRRIEKEDPQFTRMSHAWSDALRDGFTLISL
jgi:putative proteasome-type protease